ncbi:hypothetical protein HPB48_000593 [Haemaphysalis longicornis]|uniref:F-box domain-containing protein n=1 Tax=Haemaphysalis longicornis TaxID=44386 RepID=A0A9J6FTN1_HAELO|nr:hypothetical protein HPB48_000593 [Haemaphysalis longicornis]
MEDIVEGEYLARQESPRPDEEEGEEELKAFIGFWPRALAEDAPDVEQGPWASLPDVLLETVYSMLPIHDRYAMSQVCRNWYRVFYSPQVWSVFVLDDRTMTRRKFNYYMGYQHLLDHYRTQVCVHKIGRHIRHLLIPAMSNFFNLYEFMVIMAYFGERNNALGQLRRFEFTFGCHLLGNNADMQRPQDSVFGTGGKLLESLKRLMCCFTGLRHLALTDLLLEPQEAKFLLDDVAEACMTTLRTLRLINCSKEPYPFLHAGVFLNLTTLYISPQHLDDDLVTLLSYTCLRDLHLVQTTYTEVGLRVSPRVWRECRRAAPRLRVHLSVEGTVAKEVIWQDSAPVHSVIYKTAYNQVGPESALTAATYYPDDLRTYAFLGLPRFHMPKRFVDRPDSALVSSNSLCFSLNYCDAMLVPELKRRRTLNETSRSQMNGDLKLSSSVVPVRRLETLVIRERISYGHRAPAGLPRPLAAAFHRTWQRRHQEVRLAAQPGMERGVLRVAPAHVPVIRRRLPGSVTDPGLPMGAPNGQAVQDHRAARVRQQGLLPSVAAAVHERVPLPGRRAQTVLFVERFLLAHLKLAFFTVGDATVTLWRRPSFIREENLVAMKKRAG